MDRSILFAFAHPDDESFWGAGVAARYHAEGARVILVTATRGERGSTGSPPLCAIEELPQVREAELREAARIAHFDPVYFLDYADQTLSSADADDVRRKLVRLLRAHRPAVVVTFDPDGANRHPDHIAISRFTSDAIAAAADSRWYPELGSPHAVARLLWTPTLRPWDVVAASLADTPSVDFAIDTSRWRAVRRAALAAHRTQRESIGRLFLNRPDVELIFDVEVFRHAFGPPLRSRPAGDLFEGIDLA